MKELGHVTAAEILAAGKDRRTKRLTGLNGLVIDLLSRENVLENDTVFILIDAKKRYFTVKELKTEGDLLRIRAVETGYYNILKGSKDLNLHTLIHADVFLVEDEKEIQKIREESCYC